MINPEDGLLATKWDPQKVTRTYPRGQEPHATADVLRRRPANSKRRS